MHAFMPLRVACWFSTEVDNATTWCVKHRNSAMDVATLHTSVNNAARNLLCGTERDALWPVVADLAKNVTGIPSMDDCSASRTPPFKPFKPQNRLCGNDWPCSGTTMVGVVRVMNVANLLKSVVDDKVGGAFVELGVWRGGVCIFARRLLDLLGEADRRVEVFDAFESLPGYGGNADFLMNSKASVMDNFRRAGVDLDRVGFHKGLFKDSLPAFAKRETGAIAVLRVDGNFYDSYQDAMYYLYERVPVGGYVIFDDVMSHSRVMRFWNDFKADYGVTETLHRIDLHSAYFRKTRSVSIDMKRMRAPQDANKG